MNVYISGGNIHKTITRYYSPHLFTFLDTMEIPYSFKRWNQVKETLPTDEIALVEIPHIQGVDYRTELAVYCYARRLICFINDKWLGPQGNPNETSWLLIQLVSLLKNNKFL